MASVVRLAAFLPVSFSGLGEGGSGFRIAVEMIVEIIIA